MKIGMGENLVYSWLRHVKDCQIVQTNWKTSPYWKLKHNTKLKDLMNDFVSHFKVNHNYNVFKKNNSLEQIIRQGECDVLGVSIQKESKIYAVDVAFHEKGLNYGKTNETVMKVIAKTVRTAISLWGYFDNTDAEIIFASPKIGKTLLGILQPCIDEINKIFKDNALGFKARLICNDEFNDIILEPVLRLSDKIADTSELFLRAYQLSKLFLDKNAKPVKKKSSTTIINNANEYKDFKIGKLVSIVFRGLLEEGKASAEEIVEMQKVDYSKQVFDLQYSVLVKDGTSFNKARYYTLPLTIKGVKYYLCSQWFETLTNNDRPYLIKWINTHK